ASSHALRRPAWRAPPPPGERPARGRGSVHVPPIPLNPPPGSRWAASDPAVEETFVRPLRRAGIPTTVRDTRGSDIDGACGQLAAEALAATAPKVKEPTR